MKLLVIDREKMTVQRADSVEEADSMAELDGLGTEQLAWALEEYGRCDGNNYTIIWEEWSEWEGRPEQ